MIDAAPPGTTPGVPAAQREGNPMAAKLFWSWRDRLAAFAHTYLPGERGLILTGALSAAIYALLTAAFPITSWWFRTDDNLGTIPARVAWARPLLLLGGPHLLSTWMAILTVIVVVTLFGLQGLALFAAQHSSDVARARRIVIGFAIAFIVTQVWMQPVTSTDLYGYIARAYLIATLHQNPTISLSVLLPGGFLVPHARPPAPYGPLWLLICGGVGLLSGENLLLAMLLFKAIAALAAIGTILLVARLIDRIMPGQRVTALVLFAWSPLLILEAIGNGHNDIVMMICVVASLSAIQARRPLWAFPLLALGVLIKYSMGALVPLWAAYLLLQFCWRAEGATKVKTLPGSRADLRAWLGQIEWRPVLRIFGAGGAISVALAVICYAPFWVGFKTFTGLGQQLGATYFNGSLAGLIYAALQWSATGAHAASLGAAIRYSLYAVFAAYVVWQTGLTLRRGHGASVTLLAQMSGKVVFATLVLVTFWYQPWYIVWLLPLAALAPDGILRRHALALAFGGVLTYVVEYFAFVNQSALARGFFVQVFLVIVAFSPLLILRHNTEGSLRRTLRRLFSGLSERVALHPQLTERVMLGLILAIAAFLRLVRLGVSDTESTASALRHLSGTLSVSLADTRGLQGPFDLVQNLLTRVFGQTTLALLLPTALLGTLTVWLIYLLALELFRDLGPERRHWLSLLAALLAATAQWHVALSRSGAQVILLPLLISAAALAFWRAQREFTQPGGTGGGHQVRYLALAGASIGLMGDLDPSLWPLPVLLVGAVAIIGWRLAWWRHLREVDVAAIGGSIGLTVLPTIWESISPGAGFAPGSPVLARGGAGVSASFAPLAPSYWGHLFSTIGSVLHVILTQDYDVAGPGAGGVPIVPTLLVPFVVVGLALVMKRWRQPSYTLLLTLTALPIAVVLVTGAAPSLIEAAILLPVVCLVPALGLEQVAHWIATLPGVIAGAEINTIFISRQNLLRVALMLMVVVLTISTFFWYFASTLSGPTHIVQPL